MKNPQEVQYCISWGFKLAERMGLHIMKLGETE